MKYPDENRDTEIAGALVAAIAKRVTHPWVLMEICGSQTHTIMRHGLDELLLPGLELVHGLGCAVCMTPVEMVDKATALASRSDVILVCSDDILRVPGSHFDLQRLKTAGGNIQIAFSPLHALKVARENPQAKVVFFAIGFETSAPAHAMAICLAKELGLTNFSILVSHALALPAIRLLLERPNNRVQGFIVPGSVCAVMGSHRYEQLVREFQVPIVIAGFEPLDLLQAALMLVEQLEAGRAELASQYGRSLPSAGNGAAQQIVETVFEVCDGKWRGIGPIGGGGLRLRPEFAAYDAERIFEIEETYAEQPPGCVSGLILQGQMRPTDCPAFGTTCTPDTPLATPMIPGDGACAAYYRYRRRAYRPEDTT